MIVQGIDANSVSHPLLLAADGSVIVSATNLTTTGGKIKVDAAGRVITDVDSPSYLQPVGGVDGIINLNLAAGTNTLDAYTVPASQRHQLDMFTIAYIGTVAAVNLVPYIKRGATYTYMASISPPVSSRYVNFSVSIILEAADIVGTLITGATLNDDFVMSVFHRRIL